MAPARVPAGTVGADVAAVFAVVFLAELGDKTQLVALTLASRHPGLKVLAVLLATLKSAGFPRPFGYGEEDLFLTMAGDGRELKFDFPLLEKSLSNQVLMSLVSQEEALRRAEKIPARVNSLFYPYRFEFDFSEETLAEPHRLKNDDKIFLQAKDNARLALETVIKFHEPTALLILDSILPKELPPPILLDEAEQDVGSRELDETDLIHSSKIPPAVAQPLRKGKIFGYFTKTEIIIMAIGTLITAVIIYLILEFY